MTSALGAAVVFAVAAWAFLDGEPSDVPHPATDAAREGRLLARPQPRARAGAPRGRRQLAHRAELYVPAGYDPGTAAALVVTLHGAGGDAANGFGQLLPLADEAGLILLSPKSRDSTWDVIFRGYGPDVARIDELLEDVFAQYLVDPRRVFVSGFSDGASYALSLGLTNGDLFDGIVAFSPGFAVPAAPHGKPRIFVSHGIDDAVLRIDATSRRLVPQLRGSGYDVEYREFDGPHTVPPAIARDAVAWLREERD